jgi:membrane fusion protein, multidrug efflux system
MNSLVGRRAAVGAALLLVAAGAACSKSAEGRPENGAPGAPGGGRGGPGGPGVVLGPTDLAPVSRGTIERTIPVTGDLRPIETVDVKARLEGDLEQVYVREGQRVAQGQLLARFEASEQVSGRRSAEADIEAVRTELSTAQWNLEQSEELFKQGALPERDVRAARQQVSAARARLVAAQSRLTSTSSFERDTRVLAPTTGTIATRVVEDGEHVARGATMFTLVRTDVLELAAALPARSANGVTPGQVVRFTADGASFEGRVARVSPTVDPVSRSITVYVQVPNPGSRLKGGTFASGRIVGGTRQGALLVPTAALRQGEGGQPYVFTVAADKIDQKPVQLGFVDEGRGMAEVLSGLAEGDRVVVGQVGTLGRGMSVTIVGGGEARASRGGPPAPR